MRISEAMAWMGINSNAGKTYLAQKQGVENPEVNLAAEATLPLIADLGEHFPNHTRRIIISYSPDRENVTIEMVGDWTGRMVKVAGRAFAHCYTKYSQATRLGKDRTTFRTRPTKEELEEELRRQAAATLEYEIQVGVRDRSGKLIPGAAEAYNRGKLPTTLPIAVELPDLDPIPIPPPKVDPVREVRVIKDSPLSFDPSPRLTVIPEPEPLQPLPQGLDGSPIFPPPQSMKHAGPIEPGMVGTGVHPIISSSSSSPPVRESPVLNIPSEFSELLNENPVSE